MIQRHRVIPCLLLKGDGLVKTVRFRDPRYVGDPINAVRLFNDLEVDELIFLDITATKENRAPDYERLRDIASECFMPIGYGGGVHSLEQAERLFELGIEKVALTTAAAENPRLIAEISRRYGSQSVIVGIDVKRDFFKRPFVWTRGGSVKVPMRPKDYARKLEEMGAGEILLTSIERDGTQAGYDGALIADVANSVEIPVIACGGAGRLQDVVTAVGAGASAAAAGSLFVFHGPHKAVLINYPTQRELRQLWHGDTPPIAPGTRT